MKLNVLFEDNHMLAVLKPAGLLVQGDRSGDETLLDVAGAYLKQKYDKPGNVYLGLVHRLDRNVSGVVLLARTSKAAGRLAEQFRQGTVTKIYRAVVAGRPSAEGELKSWLSGKGDARGVTKARPAPFDGARESLLRYHVVNSAVGWTLVEVRPVTGRRHQIRAQFALAGHPLLGDVKYGSVRRLPDHRIALHASRLAVAHPTGGHEVVISAPEPEDWPWPVASGKER